jgi:hypothetical protein
MEYCFVLEPVTGEQVGILVALLLLGLNLGWMAFRPRKVRDV